MRPSRLFIPLPTAAENHQEHNAQALVDAGAAAMILECDLTLETLVRTVTGILTVGERRLAMANASRQLGKKDAAAMIADAILERYGHN